MSGGMKLRLWSSLWIVNSKVHVDRYIWSLEKHTYIPKGPFCPVSKEKKKKKISFWEGREWLPLLYLKRENPLIFIHCL